VGIDATDFGTVEASESLTGRHMWFDGESVSLLIHGERDDRLKLLEAWIRAEGLEPAALHHHALETARKRQSEEIWEALEGATR
jgi:hypothetical protein